MTCIGYAEFTDRISCLGYDSLINIPTRKTSTTTTCINHIYVKSTTSTKSGVLGMNVSDHDAIFSSLIDQRPFRHLKNNKFKDYSFKKQLSEFLGSFDVFDYFYIHGKFKMLIKIIETSFNFHC